MVEPDSGERSDNVGGTFCRLPLFNTATPQRATGSRPLTGTAHKIHSRPLPMALCQGTGGVEGGGGGPRQQPTPPQQLQQLQFPPAPGSSPRAPLNNSAPLRGGGGARRGHPHPPTPPLKDWAKFSSGPLTNQKFSRKAQHHRRRGKGGAADRGVWAAKTVKRPPQQPAQPPVRQLLGAADAQPAHSATSSTAPAHQLLGSANAETTPAGAPAAAADRTQRPDATCEGTNG